MPNKLPTPTFFAPIPGQSLTDKPGNAPWEHPPKYSDPQEAMQYLANQMLIPANTVKILMLLKAKVPVDWIAHTFLFTGFGQGLWLPPVIVILAKPVIAVIIAIAKRGGIKPVLNFPKGIDPSLVRLAQLQKETTSVDNKLSQLGSSAIDESADNGQGSAQTAPSQASDGTQQATSPQTSLIQRPTGSSQ